MVDITQSERRIFLRVPQKVRRKKNKGSVKTIKTERTKIRGKGKIT